MDDNLEEYDAVKVWRDWNGESPARIDWGLLDTLKKPERDGTASYRREMTQVIRPRSKDNLKWWRWAESRDSWRDGKIGWIIPSESAYNADRDTFAKHRMNALVNSAEAKEAIASQVGNVAIEKSPLRRMIFGSEDVTWGLPTLRVIRSNGKRYTGRASIRYSDGEAVYHIQQGNRRPLEFTEDEIKSYRYSDRLGHWVIELA